jgi:hypothetical protein
MFFRRNLGKNKVIHFTLVQHPSPLPARALPPSLPPPPLGNRRRQEGFRFLPGASISIMFLFLKFMGVFIYSIGIIIQRQKFYFNEKIKKNNRSDEISASERNSILISKLKKYIIGSVEIAARERNSKKRTISRF